jgi:hypothetical protein
MSYTPCTSHPSWRDHFNIWQTKYWNRSFMNRYNVKELSPLWETVPTYWHLSPTITTPNKTCWPFLQFLLTGFNFFLHGKFKHNYKLYNYQNYNKGGIKSYSSILKLLERCFLSVTLLHLESSTVQLQTFAVRWRIIAVPKSNSCMEVFNTSTKQTHFHSTADVW